MKCKWEIEVLCRKLSNSECFMRHSLKMCIKFSRLYRAFERFLIQRYEIIGILETCGGY